MAIQPIQDNTQTKEFAVGLAKIINGLADGIDLSDIGLVTEFPKMIGGIEKIPGEKLGMTNEQREEVRDSIRGINFGDKDAEAIAEKALIAVDAVADLIVEVAK